MLVSSFLLFARLSVAPVLEPVALKSDDSWLCPAASRGAVVRFEVVCDVPGKPKSFVPFRATGYICLTASAFRITVAELYGSANLEYKDGALGVSATGDPGDLGQHPPKRMEYVEAFSLAIDELGFDGLGALCARLLRDGARRGVGETSRISSSGGSYSEAVFGPGLGALQKYTEVLVISKRPENVRRTVAKFAVLPN